MKEKSAVYLHNKMKNFFSSSKGQGDTFWYIIGAILAIVVLVVMIIIYTNVAGTASKDIQTCRGPGTYCAAQCKSGDSEIKVFSAGCPKGQKCCQGPVI